MNRKVKFKEMKRWESRPYYKGLPIPYTTLIDNDDTPNFQAVDQARIFECLAQQLCGVCGQSLRTDDEERWLAFIGGEECAKTLEFIDPPMHPECAYYAAETCPYLKNEDGKYSNKINTKAPEDANLTLLYEVDKARPKRLMIYFCKGFKVRSEGQVVYLIAKKDPHIIDWEAMPESK